MMFPNEFSKFELSVYSSKKFSVNEIRLREAISRVLSNFFASHSANFTQRTVPGKTNEFIWRVEQKTKITLRADGIFLSAGGEIPRVNGPAIFKKKKDIRQRFIAAAWYYFHKLEEPDFAEAIDRSVLGTKLDELTDISFVGLARASLLYERSLRIKQLSLQKVELIDPLQDQTDKSIQALAQLKFRDDGEKVSAFRGHCTTSSPIPINDDILTLDEGHRNSRGIESFQYARRQDEFIGRQELVSQVLAEFLDFEAPFSKKNAFRWTLVYGEAGIGKSRFALETLRCLYHQKSSKFEKKYLGFVKRNRSDASLTLSKEKIDTWSIDGPVFLILDYAGANRELVAVIDAMKTKAEFLGQPIRLMLLERRGDSGRLGDLDRIDAEESYLRDTCYQPANHHDACGIGIRLQSLEKDETAQLMRERIGRERGYIHEDETDEFLIQRLMDISENERRPLFAAMVASAIADEDPNSGSSVVTGADRLKKRSNTLRYLIRRERDKFWRTVNDTEPFTTLGEHENLLALATFTRGLDLTILDPTWQQAKAHTPSNDTFDSRRYSRMTTIEQKSDLTGMPIGSLEPDFIGEWFVLSRLSPEARLDANVPFNRPDLNVFVNLGWYHGRERAAQFIQQCHQNYPDEVCKLGYLLPKAGTFCDYVISLLRDLLLDWRRVLSHFKGSFDNEADRRSFEVIASRAAEVFGILQQHVNAASDLSEAVRDDIADATEIYVYIQSWMLSPILRDGRDKGLLLRGAIAKHRGARSLLDTSISIQEIMRSSKLNNEPANHLNVISEPRSVSFKIIGEAALGLSKSYNRRS